MNRKVKIIITSIIGVILITSITVFAYTIANDPNQSGSPLSYIPSSSTLVVRVDYNGTVLYLFESNNTTSVIINSLEIKSGNVSLSKGNESLNITLRYNSTYGGFEIYSINVSSLLEKIAQFNSSVLPYLNNVNTSLYAYVTGQGSLVLGSFNGIKGSIDAYNSGKNFVPLGKYLNESDNASFYYAPANSSLHLKYAWGGINATSLYAYAVFTNSSSLNFTGSFSFNGFDVKSLSAHEIEVTYQFGNFSALLTKLKEMG